MKVANRPFDNIQVQQQESSSTFLRGWTMGFLAPLLSENFTFETEEGKKPCFAKFPVNGDLDKVQHFYFAVKNPRSDVGNFVRVGTSRAWPKIVSSYLPWNTKEQNTRNIFAGYEPKQFLEELKKHVSKYPHLKWLLFPTFGRTASMENVFIIVVGVPQTWTDDSIFSNPTVEPVGMEIIQQNF